MLKMTAKLIDRFVFVYHYRNEVPYLRSDRFDAGHGLEEQKISREIYITTSCVTHGEFHVDLIGSAKRDVVYHPHAYFPIRTPTYDAVEYLTAQTAISAYNSTSKT